MAKTTFRDNRAKWDKLVSSLKNLDDHKVVVGVLEKAKYPNGQSVAEVAFWNEYGTQTAPARPFMRQTAETTQEAVASIQKKLKNEFIAGRDPVNCLMELGFKYSQMIKRTIIKAQGWAEPLSEATIAAKGHPKPLIDSRTLLNSIDFEVRKPKPEPEK